MKTKQEIIQWLDGAVAHLNEISRQCFNPEHYHAEVAFETVIVNRHVKQVSNALHPMFCDVSLAIQDLVNLEQDAEVRKNILRQSDKINQWFKMEIFQSYCLDEQQLVMSKITVGIVELIKTASTGNPTIKKGVPSWEITYNGNTAIVSSTMLGLKFLETLLKSPNKPFAASRLRHGGLEIHGLTQKSKQAIDDKWSYSALQKQIRAVEKMSDSEWKNGEIAKGKSPDEILSRQDEIKAAKKALRDMFDKNGNYKEFSDSGNADRNSVTDALKTILAKIQPQHSELHEHLTKNLKIGVICQYNSDVTWDLS